MLSLEAIQWEVANVCFVALRTTAWGRLSDARAFCAAYSRMHIRGATQNNL